MAPRHFHEDIDCYVVVIRIRCGLTGQIRGEVGTLLRRALTQISNYQLGCVLFLIPGRMISTGPSCANFPKLRPQTTRSGGGKEPQNMEVIPRT